MNVWTCAVTGNSTRTVILKSKKREALVMYFSEFNRAVRQFDAPERVYLSVPLPLFQGCAQC